MILAALACLALAAPPAAVPAPAPPGAVRAPFTDWRRAIVDAAAGDEREARVLGVGPASVFVYTPHDGVTAELQLATGARVRTLPPPACRGAEPVGAVGHGRLAVLHAAGSYTRDDRASDGRGPGCREEVWAVERATGRVAWRRALDGHGADASIVVEGHACYAVTEAGITALELSDGRLAWRARVGGAGPIAGDEPRIEREAGVALSASRLFLVDDPDGQWRAFGLVALDRRTGARAWRRPLDVGCAGGAAFAGVAAAGDRVAVAWTCRPRCEAGGRCPADAAHLVVASAATGAIVGRRELPRVEVAALAAGRDAFYLVEDGRYVVAVDGAGAPRWRADLGRCAEERPLTVDTSSVIAWVEPGSGGAPALVGLDLRTGAVVWRWEPPHTPPDWAVPWLGPWSVGDRIVLGDHAGVYALRVP